MSIVYKIILCSVFSLCIYAEHNTFFQQLDDALEHIDMLEGYGPLNEPHLLQGYITLICSLSSQERLTCDDEKLIEGIARKLFSRYAYRDGSHRSRIYAHAQRQTIALLVQSPHTQKLLTKLIEELPAMKHYPPLSVR